MKVLQIAPLPQYEPHMVTSSPLPNQWYLGSELLLHAMALYCIIVTHLELPFPSCMA